jgi:hypothetical protein
MESTKGRYKKKTLFTNLHVYRKRNIRDFTLMYQGNVKFIY